MRVGSASGVSGALTTVPPGAVAMIPREMFARVDIMGEGLQVSEKADGCFGGGFLGRSRISDFTFETDMCIVASEVDRRALALVEKHFIGSEMCDALGGSVGVLGAWETADDFFEGAASGIAVGGMLQIPIGRAV